MPGLPAVAGFRAALQHEEAPTVDGAVSWRTRWRLTWDPVPGAADYVVLIGTQEGVPAGRAPRVTAAPEWSISAAAGTSSLDRLAADRRTQLLFAGSQLQVSVAARAAGGTTGPGSPWFPVGETGPDGRPVGGAAPGHEGS